MNRIIILSYDYPPNNGGIARLCKEITKGFFDRDIPFHVVTNVAGRCDYENHVTRIPGARGRTEMSILKWLRENTDKSDIIICDTWHPAGSLAMMSGRKFFILAHGAEFLPGKGLFRHRIWPCYRRIVLRKSAGIIANSHYTCNLVNNIAPGLTVRAIPLAIDSQRFRPTIKKDTDDILRLCSVSRLEKFKGHDFILKTIAALPQNIRCKISFEIGGIGPYKAELERLSKDLGLENIVKFIGFIPEDALNDFYSRNDLFILCTREEPDMCNVEGFGLVFVEAQACGTACIGTKAGGIPDAVIDKKSGWLINQDNDLQLAILLTGLVNDKLAVHAMGASARNLMIKEYSLSGYIDRLLAAISYGRR